jgi:enamine deaminase RidA (YjgF/YER057c/UK114 family)
MVFTAGIIGWDEEQRFVAFDLPGQFRQLLINTLAILAEGGAGPEHVVRMTWYVVDRNDYVANLTVLGGIYRELMGSHYPAMAVVEVAALVEPLARIEIETIAVVPE